MKTEIDVWAYATEIFTALKKGLLITTKADGRVNSMTISWGMLGVEWESPVFTTFVRQHRFTHEQLEKNPEFTVSIPHGIPANKILGYCGTRSGHDVDKIAELGLDLEEPLATSVPGIRQLPLTLECQVVYSQPQDASSLTPENLKSYYPSDVAGTFHGANQDMHTAYYGQIVAAYLIE
ncbi:flavin reductase family protein [Propionibacterium sp.]|uniref:flavin reductase family protein n=1 Tax=Propionibacterium sp. TaxID=1977903 RepID=UPI0039E89B78